MTLVESVPNGEVCSDKHCPLSLSGAHDYRIESPDGPTSKGICRCCGYTRYFRNHSNDSAQLRKPRWG